MFMLVDNPYCYALHYFFKPSDHIFILGHIYSLIVYVSYYSTLVCFVSSQRVALVVEIDLSFQHLYLLVYYSLSPIVCLPQGHFIIEYT